MSALSDYLSSLVAPQNPQGFSGKLELTGELLSRLTLWRIQRKLPVDTWEKDASADLALLCEWLRVYGVEVTHLKITDYNPIVLEANQPPEPGSQQSRRQVLRKSQLSERMIYRWLPGEGIDTKREMLALFESSVDSFYDSHGPRFFSNVRADDENAYGLVEEPHSRFLNYCLSLMPNVCSLDLRRVIFSPDRFRLTFDQIFFAQLERITCSAVQAPISELNQFFIHHTQLLHITLGDCGFVRKEYQEWLDLIQATQKKIHSLVLEDLPEALQADHELLCHTLLPLRAMNQMRDNTPVAISAAPDRGLAQAIDRELQRLEEERQARERALNESHALALRAAEEARCIELLRPETLYAQAEKAMLESPGFFMLLINTGISQDTVEEAQFALKRMSHWEKEHIKYDKHIANFLIDQLRDERFSFLQVKDALMLIEQAERKEFQKTILKFEQELSFQRGLSEPVAQHELRIQQTIQARFTIPLVEELWQLTDLSMAEREIFAKKFYYLALESEAKYQEEQGRQAYFNEVIQRFIAQMSKIHEQSQRLWRYPLAADPGLASEEPSARVLEFTAPHENCLASAAIVPDLVPHAYHVRGEALRLRLMETPWLREEKVCEIRENPNGAITEQVIEVWADLDRLLLFAWRQYLRVGPTQQKLLLQSVEMLLARGANPFVKVKGEECVYEQVLRAVSAGKDETPSLQFFSQVLLEKIKQESFAEDYWLLKTLVLGVQALKNHMDAYAITLSERSEKPLILRYLQGYSRHLSERQKELPEYYDLLKRIGQFFNKENLIYYIDLMKAKAAKAKRGFFGRSRLHGNDFLVLLDSLKDGVSKGFSIDDPMLQDSKQKKLIAYDDAQGAYQMDQKRVKELTTGLPIEGTERTCGREDDQAAQSLKYCPERGPVVVAPVETGYLLSAAAVAEAVASPIPIVGGGAAARRVEGSEEGLRKLRQYEQQQSDLGFLFAKEKNPAVRDQLLQEMQSLVKKIALLEQEVGVTQESAAAYGYSNLGGSLGSVDVAESLWRQSDRDSLLSASVRSCAP